MFTMIGIKRFNENILNETLQQDCCNWLSDSHIERYINKKATTCFQNLKVYLVENDHNFNVNHVMYVCCFECFKQLVVNFLYKHFFTLDI